MQLTLAIPDTVDEQVAAIDLQIAELQARKTAVQKTRQLKCHHCGVFTCISDLTFISYQLYEQPHVCSSGDYRYGSEGQYTCPECCKTNRLCEWHGHAGVDKLRAYFGARKSVQRR